VGLQAQKHLIKKPGVEPINALSRSIHRGSLQIYPIGKGGNNKNRNPSGDELCLATHQRLGSTPHRERQAVLSPSSNDLGTREAVFLRRRTAGLRHSRLKLYAESNEKFSKPWERIKALELNLTYA
jgi:hypothetical protein